MKIGKMIRRLWIRFNMSWANAAEMQRRIEEEKLRIQKRHPFI